MSRVPIDEAGRLESLNRLDLLGSAPEERFDRITRLARRLLGTPAAVIALVGVDRVWLKSALGLAPREVSRPGTHFERALGSRRPYTHSGSEPDPLGMRSFAGKSLAEPAGHRVGVLAVMDPDLREFGEDDLELLVDLAAVAERELGRSAFDRMLDEYRGHAAWAQSVMDNVAEALVTIDQEGRIRSVNRAGVAMFRRPVGALIGSTVPQMLAPEDQDELDRILRQHLAAPAESFSVHREVTALGGDGTRFPVEIDLGGTWVTEDETMLVAVIRDITERKNAEARLVEALGKQERAIQVLDRALLLSQRFHQARLCVLALGDVANDRHQHGLVLGDSGPAEVDLDRELGVVPAHRRHLAVHAERLGRRRQVVAHDAVHLVLVLGSQELRQGLAHELAGRAPEHAHARAVDGTDAALLVDRDQRPGHVG